MYMYSVSFIPTGYAVVIVGSSCIVYISKMFCGMIQSFSIPVPNDSVLRSLIVYVILFFHSLF